VNKRSGSTRQARVVLRSKYSRAYARHLEFGRLTLPGSVPFFAQSVDEMAAAWDKAITGIDTSFMIGDTFEEWAARQPVRPVVRRAWPIRAASTVAEHAKQSWYVLVDVVEYLSTGRRR